MNETEFRALVKKMREAQERFFRTRSDSLLQLAKRYEKEVDRELNRDPSERMLFDE